MRRFQPQLQVVTTTSSSPGSSSSPSSLSSPHGETQQPTERLDALTQLGASLYAEALHLCDNEEEAAAYASAALAQWLEEQDESARAQRPRGTC